MAERNKATMAVDIIGNQREIVAFLRDVTGSRSLYEEVSPAGFEGLSRILDHVDQELLQATTLIQSH